jgi:hypothetical protein
MIHNIAELGKHRVLGHRFTVHLASRGIFESDFDRQFYRVTSVGKALAGIDGSSSRSIEGEKPILSAVEGTAYEVWCRNSAAELA